MHDHITLEGHSYVKRQRREVSLPSDNSTMLKRAKREMPAPRIMCYEDQRQQPPATRGNVDGDRPPEGEYVDTDTDSSDNEEESPNIPANASCLPLRICPVGTNVIRYREPGKRRAADAISTRRLKHQLWVRGTVWHARALRHHVLILCLLDTVAGGRSLVSGELWHPLRS